MTIRNFSGLVHLLKLWRDPGVPVADGLVLFMSVFVSAFLRIMVFTF